MFRSPSRATKEEAEQARREELMAHLMADASPTTTPVPGSPCGSPSRSRHHRRRRAPWEVEDRLGEMGYLTDDGNHVVRQKEVTVNGRGALVAYRQELDEVDPAVLGVLREARDRRLARAERLRAKNGEQIRERPVPPLLEERLREARERFKKETAAPSSPSPLAREHKPAKETKPGRVEERGSVVRRGPPSLRRMKRGARVERMAEEEEEEEDLDLWQKLADEYDEGRSTLRRAKNAD